MRSSETEGRFKALLGERGLVQEQLRAGDLIDVMHDYYEDVRVEDVIAEVDGDMLLFQWGTYDWGSGPSFEFDLTRQVIKAQGAGDDAIWQLHVTLRFSTSPETEQLGSGNRWCHGTSELDGFKAFIEAAQATAFARSHQPSSVDIGFESAE